MMQAALPGSMSLADDSQSADGQLQLGLQLIQQSYTRRAGRFHGLTYGSDQADF